MCKTATCPLYAANSITECNARYLDDVQTYSSILQLLLLLLFQCNGDWNAVSDMCVTLYKILYMQNGKENAMWIRGDVSAGKNCMFDAVTAFCVNVGYISNPIRHFIYGLC